VTCMRNVGAWKVSCLLPCLCAVKVAKAIFAPLCNVRCFCQAREMAFGNVELPNAPEDQRNAAEMAAARGFATVGRHRTDEERSGGLGSRVGGV